VNSFDWEDLIWINLPVFHLIQFVHFARSAEVNQYNKGADEIKFVEEYHIGSAQPPIIMIYSAVGLRPDTCC
jgi:hypothetical protein